MTPGLEGFVFKCVFKGSSQTALHCCSAPFWIEYELPVFVVRPHAPNREVRTVTFRYEYMYRSTPTKYKHTKLPNFAIRLIAVNSVHRLYV